MSETRNEAGLVAVAVLVGFCLGAGLANRCNHHADKKTTVDTVTVRDTVKRIEPVPVDSTVTGTIALPCIPSPPREGRDMVIPTVPKADVRVFPPSKMDSVLWPMGDGKFGSHDTVWVTVPRTQKRYQDSTYTAWVSGYEPRLDSIEVYRKTVFVTKTEEGRVKNRRLTFGLTGGFGYGLINRKPDLFVGVGATIRLF